MRYWHPRMGYLPGRWILSKRKRRHPEWVAPSQEETASRCFSAYLVRCASPALEHPRLRGAVLCGVDGAPFRCPQLYCKACGGSTTSEFCWSSRGLVINPTLVSYAPSRIDHRHAHPCQGESSRTCPLGTYNSNDGQGGLQVSKLYPAEYVCETG